MKYGMKGMSIIEAISNMSENERKLVLNTANLSILDCKAIMGYKGDLGPEYIMNEWGEYEAPAKLPTIKSGKSATPKRDRKSRKNFLKDKSRHGYHWPRRWECREYMRGDKDKLDKEAMDLDYKAQMVELDGTQEDYTEITNTFYYEFGQFVVRDVENLNKWFSYEKIKHEGYIVLDYIETNLPRWEKFLLNMYPYIPAKIVQKVLSNFTARSIERMEYIINEAREREIQREINDLSYRAYEKNTEAIALMREGRELNKEAEKLVKEKNENKFYF